MRFTKSEAERPLPSVRASKRRSGAGCLLWAVCRRRNMVRKVRHMGIQRPRALQESLPPDTLPGRPLKELRMHRLATLPLLMIALAACSTSPAPTPTPATFTVTGVLDLGGNRVYNETEGCTGTGGYADIRYGAQVRVTDATGAVVALGALSAGEPHDRFPEVPKADQCRFRFEVSGVPESGNLYGVEVAHRGIVSFARTDATNVQLTLG